MGVDSHHKAEVFCHNGHGGVSSHLGHVIVAGVGPESVHGEAIL